MNIKLSKLTMLLLLSIGTAARADVIIELVQPDSFHDLFIPDMTPEQAQRQFVRTIKKALSSLTDNSKEDSGHLIIHFEDVDLAGNIQPMQGIQNQEVRVIHLLDPIRLKFTYQLKGKDGAVIREGEADLRGHVRQTDMRGRTHTRTLPAERRMMREWFNRTIGPLPTP